MKARHYELDANANKLVEDNIRMAYWLANKWQGKLTGMLSYEDILSDCMLGLCKAAAQFKPELGFKFATYASRAMENQIKMDLRVPSVQHRDIPFSDLIREDSEGNETEPLDNYALLELNNSFKSNIDEWIDAEYVIEAVNKVRGKLKQRDIHIYDLSREEGATQRKIADQLGLSQSYVSRILKRTHKNIRKELAKTN